MRVAICDDNQQDIERIRRYTLRMIDYAVEYVFYTRPEELLRECADAEQKPDMYILDIEMPGMDGLAVAKQIRVIYLIRSVRQIPRHYWCFLPAIPNTCQVYLKLSHLILFQNQSQKKGSVCCLRRQEPI